MTVAISYVCLGYASSVSGEEARDVVFLFEEMDVFVNEEAGSFERGFRGKMDAGKHIGGVALDDGGGMSQRRCFVAFTAHPLPAGRKARPSSQRIVQQNVEGAQN